ncbi:hypothetical protein FH968_17555 [Buttiauxella sp. B2]|uniref:hypothetical protein n=1 Tax=Buttiauxella sp. B2 TaxID=2587812 RepID=UPI001121E2E5|nr:hypothetical protein [Buttiauxella sp. B2]TNV17866.1 hypothetical protein FH968_17555 [Buttiauxella sp. B2]
MDKTYGLDIADLRIQLLHFTTRYLGEINGMTDAVKGGVGLIIGNIVRSNQYTESDRAKIQEFAAANGYTYQQLSQIVEKALSEWLVHVEQFKKG